MGHHRQSDDPRCQTPSARGKRIKNRLIDAEIGKDIFHARAVILRGGIEINTIALANHSRWQFFVATPANHDHFLANPRIGS